MKTTRKIMEVVFECYWEIAKRTQFDLYLGTTINHKLLLDDVSTTEMLERSTQLIELFHVGSSIHFSLALIAKLKEKDLEAFLISTSNNDFCVGYYNENKSFFIANIAEDIKRFTKDEQQIPTLQQRSPMRCKINAAIPLEIFKSDNPKIRIYSNPFGSDKKFFSTFLEIYRDI